MIRKPDSSGGRWCCCCSCARTLYICMTDARDAARTAVAAQTVQASAAVS